VYTVNVLAAASCDLLILILAILNEQKIENRRLRQFLIEIVQVDAFIPV
jgi:hypothetical protein